VKETQNNKYYLAVSVSLITFAVYLTSLHHGFVEWDDAQYVVENPHIRSLDWSFLRWAFFDFYASNWHPLTWLSHAVDYSIWGLNPLGHHLTNVVLHAVNTWAVVFLAIVLLGAARERMDANESWLDERMTLITAGVTGLLFGLHPLHVESVAWVAERKDLLCAFFYILSMMTYTKYAVTGSGRIQQKGGLSPFWNKRYLFSLGFFILALLSKPMAVSLPAVLVILDWYPFGKIQSLASFWKSVVNKLPFIILSLGSAVLTILAQSAGRAIVSMESVPLSTRLIVAAKALVVYLWEMVWPFNLSPFYPYPTVVSLLSWRYLFAIAIVIAISTVCAIAARRQRLWMTLWGYYVITLLPVIGIMQVGRQAMADRYTYLPSLGPFLAIGLAAAVIFQKVISKSRRRLTARLIVVLGLFLLSFMIHITIGQIGIWQSGIKLWSHVIEQRPERLYLAYYYRGLAFENTGQPEKAVEDYNTAIALNPDYREAFISRGSALEKMGRLDSALDDLNRAIALGPTYKAFFNRGVILEKMGRIGGAIADYLSAIVLNPSGYDAYLAVARSYGRAGSFDKAIEYFSRCMAMNPKDADLYNDRGLSFFFLGRSDRALQDFNMAISLDPTLAIAYRNRGNLNLRRGDKMSAISDYQKACRFGDERACGALGTIR
jgi:tetratricopeptide (TPR) repeat protein